MSAFALKDLAEFVPILAQGALVTIEVFVCGLIVATVLGLLWALMRVSGIPALAGFSKALINTIRGIPILVQLFFIYFVLPDVGIQMSAFQAGFIGLGFAYSCYMAEVFRGGIEAVDPGQVEAAKSLGMSRIMTLWRVVLPQAFKIALAPTVGYMVQIIKGTSLAAIIGFAEVTRSGQIINNATFQPLMVFSVVAAIYFLLCWPLSLLAARMERRHSAALAH